MFNFIQKEGQNENKKRRFLDFFVLMPYVPFFIFNLKIHEKDKNAKNVSSSINL